MSLRSMMLLRVVAPTRKNICLTAWLMSPGSMPCWLMMEWKTLSCWTIEEMVCVSESSQVLLERFLKPVGFMLENPCRLSCSNKAGTVGRESQAAGVRLLVKHRRDQNLHKIMVILKYQLLELESFP